MTDFETTLQNLARTVKNDTIELCAKRIAPIGPRPCNCERCDCHNQGDAEAVASWDSSTADAASIRALAD
jgi:hypothetical protein